MNLRSVPARGTVSLVALCFIAVLGIALASYLALTTRAMQLSNRSFQANLSQQLAEFGLEEGLRAFNNYDWSGWSSNPANITGATSTWTLDSTYKRATRTISFADGKLGQHVTATIKIRIDNYDANAVGAAWNSGANYRVDNVVSYTDGNWYRCISPNTNKAPATTNSNTMYWIQEQNAIASTMTWITGTTYAQGNMANRLGNWFRYTAAASSTNAPPSSASNNSYWTYVPYVSADADLHYTNESILNYYASWYRYNNGWETNPTLTWRWRANANYSVGDVIWSGNTWYRCKTAHLSGASFSATNWDSASTLTAAAGGNWATWDNATTYAIGDVVYYSSRWFRCLVSNIGQTPSTTSTYWSISPRLSPEWDSNKQYNQYDVVRYNGVWYLSLSSTNNVAQNPSTATSYWIGADTTNSSYVWNSTTSYGASNVFRCYGGAWYKAVAANTGKTPNNTSYWSAAWTNSYGVTTGAPVIYAEAAVAIAGNPAVTTQLRGLLAPAPLFPNAMAATDSLVFNGGTIDSYDSNAAVYGGSNIGSSAVLAAGSTLTINSAMTISGYLAWPSPPAGVAGTTTLNGNAYSDDKSRVSRTPNIPSFAIHSVPNGAQLTTTTATLGFAGSTTPAVYYYTSTLGVTNMTLNGASEMITIAGPTILYIPGNLRINTSTGARIRILPTGSLRLVVGRDFRVEADGGGIENQTLDPSKCTILCSRNGADTFEFSVPGTTTKFYGTIYIPESSSVLTIGSGAEIFGAISAQNITCSGTFTLHYDSSLRYTSISGVDQPFMISEWRELTQAEQATMP